MFPFLAALLACFVVIKLWDIVHYFVSGAV